MVLYNCALICGGNMLNTIIKSEESNSDMTHSKLADMQCD